MTIEDDIANAKTITGGPSGGAQNSGEDVAIGIPVGDELHWYMCPHQMLATFITNLRTYGAAAAEARAGRPIQHPDDIKVAYHVIGLPRWGRDPNGQSIAMQFRTSEGVPVTLAMKNQDALDFAEKLRAEVGQLPPSSPPRQ